ncbi:MAG: FtsL-like putative cell division protein [Chitinophagales bacterium]|nr:FtsL-like putative cell division protein [Chitinophagales bacterium]
MNQKSKSPKTTDSIFFIFKENMNFVAYLVLLCFLYISNRHLAVNLIREINVKSKELKELRWDYLTINSKLMYKSNFSQVVANAKSLDLEPLNTPPIIIELSKKEYESQN